MYKKVQFIAHCVYTAPNHVWDDHAQIWKDQYNGQGLTTEQDIEKRIALVRAAIEEAQKKADANAQVLKVFAMPECFFQGKDGAYTIENVTGTLEQLQALVMDEKWHDWIFAFGTINGFYDEDGVTEMINLAPVIKGGFGDKSKGHENSVLIQKAKFCLELIEAGKLKGGGLTSNEVGFGRTENDERLLMLLRHVLEPAQQDKIKQVFETNGGELGGWPKLKMTIEAGLDRFDKTWVVREIRNVAMPTGLIWERDWQPVANKLVTTLGAPLKIRDAMLAKRGNQDKFKEIVTALVDQNRRVEVEQELSKAGFPLDRWERIRERLQSSLSNDALLKDIVKSQPSPAPLSAQVWGRDWMAAAKKLLQLYVTQFKQVDIGSASQIDAKEIKVLLSTQNKDFFNPDDFRFSFNDVVGADNKKLAFGLEICADHGEGRLKSALAATAKEHGKKDPDVVDIQLIVSAGMCIQTGWIAVRQGGYLFNCDGWNIAGTMRGGFNGVIEKVEFTDPTKNKEEYEPHSEVRQHGSANSFLPLSIALKADVADGIFAKGAGKLHAYGPVDLP